MNRPSIRIDCEFLRNAEMAILVLNGQSMKSVGVQYDVSEPRVHQILHHVVQIAAPKVKPKVIDSQQGRNIPIWWLRNNRTEIIAKINSVCAEV